MSRHFDQASRSRSGVKDDEGIIFQPLIAMNAVS
jgi:hypothetical protein